MRPIPTLTRRDRIVLVLFAVAVVILGLIESNPNH